MTPGPDSELLYRAWQDACRHIEIQDFAQIMAAALGEVLPLYALDVYEFSESARGLVHVARAQPGRDGTPDYTRIRCAPAQAARLAQWIRRGVCHAPGEALLEHSGLPTLLPGLHEHSLLGGLRSPHGVQGLLRVQPAQGKRFATSQRLMLDRLLEPFSTALENSQRLRTLGDQAKTAAAEKAGLLTKLGRDGIVDTVVGVEGGLKEIYSRIERVCDSDLPMLLLGETGTGKEVLAREIHQRSSRAEGPFIRVNCGAIAPELLDSELFGHEKGSFTGATAMRRGWFERAHGGSLLLDEVGELPLAAQVRLLRVLQDGVLQRVGGEAEFVVDVRVIAATHRDLPSMLLDGSFREDLWYRLATFPVELPPLRERLQDIPALALHFVARAARRFGFRTCQPTPQDVGLLVAYPWPGNIRELAAVIDRAVILGEGERLAIAKALGAALPAASAPARALGSAQPGPTAPSGHLLTLDEAMKRHIEAALVHTSGRIDGIHGAARLLDINAHTLRARMRKLGVDWNSFKSAGT